MALAATAQQSDQTGPQGYWRNPQGTVIISIANCGDALCGVVQWASDKAKTDARRGGTDPLVGVEVLSGFVQKASGRWRGHLFVPDLNKRSKADLRPIGSDQLKVTVCAVLLVCKSQVWTRTGPP